jgi:hypothetical protein
MLGWGACAVLVAQTGTANLPTGPCVDVVTQSGGLCVGRLRCPGRSQSSAPDCWWSLLLGCRIPIRQASYDHMTCRETPCGSPVPATRLLDYSMEA